MTDWTPSASDIAWCNDLLRKLNEGGIWGTSIGIYQVNHAKKTLTLLFKSLSFDQDLHKRNIAALRNIAAFKCCGYTVKETAGVDCVVDD